MRKFGKYLAIAGMTMAVMAMPMTSYALGWKNTETAAAAEEKTYEFKSGETVIKMGEEAAPALKALGTAKSTFEQDSCAYQGKAKIYTYDSLELATNNASGKECVESIYITGTQNTSATPEGIKIGSTKDDVIKAYGKNYKEDFGTLRYTLGNTQLSFYTTNNAVDAIEYLLIVTK